MLYKNFAGIESLDCSMEPVTARWRCSGSWKRLVWRAPTQTNRVGKCSKGMRQTVRIAIPIVKKARALLLDEPTSGLDLKASNEFSELLKSSHRPGRGPQHVQELVCRR
ncbi:MAG: hypothetical protein JNK48_20180 [Bryobacterales bacterium]|nr:hypothetical protein [Bryobacterales bacterium]